MTGLDSNRLSSEKSPYLQQHANDPVNWQPWDDKALKGAKRRDVPIFLSIGYSSCHWCHVMQEESFSDEKVANILNKNFVPIKIDREERPDLDRVYQKICQKVTGQGGWPLSVWITPELKPFYVGTYFPRESKHGRSGFVDVLENILTKWKEEKDKIIEKAEKWSDALRKNQELEVEERGDFSKEEIFSEAAERAFEAADVERGGFGRSGPKFPQTTWVELLFKAFVSFDKPEYKDVGIKTLEAMMNGGIRDFVGGGFHRYSTDSKWTVPHFEKMLYDNALIPNAFLSGYQITGNDDYLNAAEETFRFLKKELYHQGEGFYSSLDARTEGEEGKFYVWKPSEIRDIIEDETLASIFIERYGISEDGNFEGKNVLTISKNLEKLSSKYGIGLEELEKKLEKAKQKLSQAREERTRPSRDEKILAGWNGLVISALARWSPLINQNYLELAEETLKFIRENLWDEQENKLYRRYKEEDVSVQAFLEDYAYLAQGAFDLYQVTSNPNYLDFARKLVMGIKEKFWEESTENLYFAPLESEEIISRPQDLQDQSTPSSVAVSLTLMIKLHPLFPETDFEKIVEEALNTYHPKIKKNPLEHASLSLVKDLNDTGTLEITLIADELPKKWFSKLSNLYLPKAVFYPRPRSSDKIEKWLDVLEMSELPSIWKRETVEKKPTAYVCVGQTCSQPLTNLDEVIKRVDSLSSNSF